jgi:hypothetical protein
MKKLELPWALLKGVTTDGDLSVIGKETGLMGRSGRVMDKQNSECYVNVTTSSTKSHITEKLWSSNLL